MNETEYLLTVLAEECAEVIQRITKALRFGLGEIQTGQPLTNRERINYEFSDLMGTFEMLEDTGTLERLPTDAKKAKVKAFMEYSRSKGTLR